MKWRSLTISIVRWTGRVFALGLFLFWGASLVEHLQQGFLHSVKELPPVWVWLGYLAHLTFLVGLLALWRWPLTGSILTLLGTFSYFGGLAISEATSHPRLVNGCGWRQSRQSRKSTRHPTGRPDRRLQG